VQQWQLIARALKSSGPNEVYCLTSVPDAESLRLVANSIADEIKVGTDGLIEELSSGALTARAIATRTERAKSLLDKVKLYESILGRPLAELQDMITTVDAAAFAAMNALPQAETSNAA
jgi:hypothetical protein